jgi:uncharacterized membrane protein YfcA
MDVAIALVIGYVAGVIAGMLGVGGGILFVPALVFGFDLAHVEAEATSLVAIVPVSIVGSWRQHAYGNVRWKDGILLGVLATGGAIAGVVIVNAVPERVIELLFAGLLLFVAAQMVRRGLSSERDGEDVSRDR